MKFCDNVRNLRRKRDLSQEYMAEKMNVSRQTISKWENGTAMPDLKKLTELAKFFEVSMDDLLGLEYDKKEIEGLANADSEAARTYINEIYSAIYDNQSQKDEKVRHLKTGIICLAVAFVCLSIGQIVNFSNYSTRFTELQNQINSISTMTNYNNNTYENEDYFSDYEIVSINKEKPYLATVKFTYAPKSYVKGTVVCFSVPSEDGKNQLIEATENNGVFTAEQEIDVSLKGDYQTIIDDGTTKTKEDLYFQFAYTYIDTSTVITEFNVALNKSADNKSEYNVGTGASEVYFCVYSDDIKIKEAYVSFGFDDKAPIYTENLRIRKNTDDNGTEYPYKVSLPAGMIVDAPPTEDKSIKEAHLNIIFEDEKGVKYSVIVSRPSTYYGTTGDDMDFTEVREIDFGNGKVLKSGDGEVL